MRPRPTAVLLLLLLILARGHAQEPAGDGREPRATLAAMAGHWHLDYDALDLGVLPQVTEESKPAVLKLVRQQIGDMRLVFAGDDYACTSPMVTMEGKVAEAGEQADAEWLHVRIIAVSRLVLNGAESTLDADRLASLPKNEYRLHDGRLYQRLQGQPLVLVFARDDEPGTPADAP
jgi:hypothetical protein